ncbi:MAG: polymorphic toxin-type HINT domain-containing protein [Actinomycetota bacterium]|nr:polymorphic toxin-type HINT domain-containing protein [Actinomycetota bacterium]
MSGYLYGSKTLAEGTVLPVDGGTVEARLPGPGWVDIRSGTMQADVVGNVLLSTASGVSNLRGDILPGGLVEVPTVALGSSSGKPLAKVTGVIVNEGTIRITGRGGLNFDCGSITNAGRIEFAATAVNAWITPGSWCPDGGPKLWNMPGGVIESWASTAYVDYGIASENDGLVVARAGRLDYAQSTGTAQDGISSGRFAGEGGIVALNRVVAGPATDLTTGVVLTGHLYGSATVPDGAILKVTGGTLAGPVMGPGWVEIDNGSVGSPVVGNVRFVRYGFLDANIASTGVVELPTVTWYSATPPIDVRYNISNYGRLRITGKSGLDFDCGSMTNHGRIEITSTATGARFTSDSSCYGTTPRLVNASDGFFESWAPDGVGLEVQFENDGTVLARGGRWLVQPPLPLNDVVHNGFFGSADSGRMSLCGLFLLGESHVVADNIGVADRCGTFVADVTGFTDSQITDVKNARYAAMGLATGANGLPVCSFRGVDLNELMGAYPEVCSYNPQQLGADAFEFFISWMPGLGTGLDIGHAIFGVDLAGRELNTNERILDGLFAVFDLAPGVVDEFTLNGVERLRYRALRLGGDLGCNSFSPQTPVLMADGSRKAIGTMRIGDVVYAADPETGRAGPRPVTDVIVGEGTKDLVDISLETGETLEATANHPFWSENRRAFVDASALVPGDMLRTSAGTAVQVTAVRRHVEVARVFNLTVADIHTFHVGQSDVLVHNINPTCRSAATRALRSALGTSPYVNGQAHHIFGWAQREGATAAHLRTFDFDINSASNGVWLPYAEHASLPVDFVGSFHRGASADYYTNYVDNYLLNTTSAGDVVVRTSNLKQWLTNGCMPINAAGVRRKPAKGTCPPDLVTHYRSFGIEIETS